MMVRESFDTYPAFGKEPEQLKNAIKVYCEALAERSTESVIGAFREHFAEDTKPPTPAGINQRAMNFVTHTPKPKPEKVEDTREELTDKQREELTVFMNNMKANLKPEKDKAPITPPDYSHWNRQTECQKTDMKHALVKSHRALLKGKSP